MAKNTDRGKPEQKQGKTPPAGPHARADLMNPDATPGAGSLPPIGETEEANSQPTSRCYSHLKLASQRAANSRNCDHVAPCMCTARRIAPHRSQSESLLLLL